MHLRNSPVNSPARRKVQPAFKRWQLQEAKAKFSRVCDLAENQGPQHVTRRGRKSVVVISEVEFDKLTHNQEKPDLMQALMACPKGPELKIPERDPNDYVPRGRPLFE